MPCGSRPRGQVPDHRGGRPAYHGTPIPCGLSDSHYRRRLLRRVFCGFWCLLCAVACPGVTHVLVSLLGLESRGKEPYRPPDAYHSVPSFHIAEMRPTESATVGQRLLVAVRLPCQNIPRPQSEPPESTCIGP